MPRKRASVQAQIDWLVDELKASRERTDELAGELRASRERTNELAGELRASRERTDELGGELRDSRERTNELRGELQSFREKTSLEFESDRRFTRGVAYAQMLNTFLNVIKFAQEDEPKRKKRRNSKQFERKAHWPSMQHFLKIVYPDRAVNLGEAIKFFQKVDSLKDQRDRITHPRDVVELRDDARRFAAMLTDHVGRGDALEFKEVLFLDVFRKTDELCAFRVGNLRA